MTILKNSYHGAPSGRTVATATDAETALILGMVSGIDFVEPIGFVHTSCTAK
jgi:hypothetical protein